ncbi:MAG: hypothetical protein LBM93_11285 [Oscillospiraceae bacterium]|jgi:hypothetical protein|nr:hypothetical protein [Oscillospiraceae bacterium]
MIKNLSVEEMQEINGGATVYSLPCPYCGESFPRSCLTTLPFDPTYITAKGLAAIDLRTHIYDCALLYV